MPSDDADELKADRVPELWFVASAFWIAGAGFQADTLRLAIQHDSGLARPIVGVITGVGFGVIFFLRGRRGPLKRQQG